MRTFRVEVYDNLQRKFVYQWVKKSLNTGLSQCCLCRRKLPLLNPSPKNVLSRGIRVPRLSGYPYLTLTSLAAKQRNEANNVRRGGPFRSSSPNPISLSKQTKLKKMQSLDALLSE
jgi:hypothetical protein